MLNVNDSHHPVQINHVDREAHPQSMNAVAGDNPEAGAITEFTGAESKQAA
jgi:hypothetical protein